MFGVNSVPVRPSLTVPATLLGSSPGGGDTKLATGGAPREPGGPRWSAATCPAFMPPRPPRPLHKLRAAKQHRRNSHGTAQAQRQKEAHSGTTP